MSTEKNINLPKAALNNTKTNLFEVINIKAISEICSKLAINTAEQS